MVGRAAIVNKKRTVENITARLSENSNKNLIKLNF
jgi:hypothetical protein